MVSNLNQYKTQVKGNSLDYKLVCVHIQRTPLFAEIKEFNECWEPFQEHIKTMVEYANKHFANKNLYLSHPDDDISESELITDNKGEVIFSDNGKIKESYRNDLNLRENSPNIVLIGYAYGHCHKWAFEDLIDCGVREIHIPQDGFLGIQKNFFPNIKEKHKKKGGYFDIRDNPKVPIQKEPKHFKEYVKAITKRQNFQLFIPQTNNPLIQYPQDKKESNSLTVIIHKSWNNLVKFLDEHK